MTRYALTKKSGLNRSTLDAVVNRNVSIDTMKVSTIRKMALALEIEPTEVLGLLIKYEDEKNQA